MPNPPRMLSSAFRFPYAAFRSPLSALALTLFVVHPLSAAETARPNVILCMADDQGWGDVAYNGHPLLKTPVLDEMARTGLRFDRFYAAAPVCSPTRGGVMTGRHPNRFGCFKWGYTLRPQEVTVAEALGRAGYTTGHFGKWHLGPVRKGNAVSPGGSGFDQWVSSPNFYENSPLMSDEGQVVRLDGESSMATVEAALPFIKEAAAEETPFLAVIWFGNPHTPHVPVPELAAMYADQPKPMQNYLAEITGIDRAMGRLREELDKLGVRENTLLWYTSDNGARPPGSTGGLRGIKGQVYEGGIRVPGIIEWPARIKSPRATDIPCNSVDIYPTLVDLVGVDVPEQPRPLDGISLLPLIDGEMTGREKPLGFWDYPIQGVSTPSAEFLRRMRAAEQGDQPAPPNAEWENQQYTKEHAPDDRRGHAAWIDGHWKLHRITGRGRAKQPRYELYNLADDPKEQNDLSEQEPRRVERMKIDLEAWQQSVIRSLNGEDYKS